MKRCLQSRQQQQQQQQQQQGGSKRFNYQLVRQQVLTLHIRQQQLVHMLQQEESNKKAAAAGIITGLFQGWLSLESATYEEQEFGKLNDQWLQKCEEYRASLHPPPQQPPQEQHKQRKQHKQSATKQKRGDQQQSNQERQTATPAVSSQRGQQAHAPPPKRHRTTAGSPRLPSTEPPQRRSLRNQHAPHDASEDVASGAPPELMLPNVVVSQLRNLLATQRFELVTVCARYAIYSHHHILLINRNISFRLAEAYALDIHSKEMLCMRTFR